MQEINYAIHLGLPSVMLNLKSYNCINLAHYINDIISNAHIQQVTEEEYSCYMYMYISLQGSKQ
jgi:hypothetical protein